MLLEYLYLTPNQKKGVQTALIVKMAQTRKIFFHVKLDTIVKTAGKSHARLGRTSRVKDKARVNRVLMDSYAIKILLIPQLGFKSASDFVK